MYLMEVTAPFFYSPFRKNSLNSNPIIFTKDDTSAVNDNCGLYALKEIIGSNFIPSNIRQIYGLPKNGPLHNSDLAGICISQNIILMVIDMEIADFNEICEKMYNRIGMELYAPVDSNNYDGCIVLLKDHFHYTRLHSMTGQMILPSDIVQIIKNIPDNNYYEMTQTIFSNFDIPINIISDQIKIEI